MDECEKSKMIGKLKSLLAKNLEILIISYTRSIATEESRLQRLQMHGAKLPENKKYYRSTTRYIKKLRGQLAEAQNLLNQI